ncbi:MAG: DNA repair protein RecN [Candidatus Aureabacteria bacterium]|nr:DNA repair protein RecN [Candidatus Auribacterota bacterium]
MKMSLSYLRLENVGIIDSIEIEFGTGLNILTGETGAGKSLIINSFNLLLGERVNADVIIKTGSDDACIEAVFNINDSKPILDFLEKTGVFSKKELSGIDYSDEILIKRFLSRNGRNKCWINSHLVSLSVIKEFGEHIADICGSHSHQELLNSDNHILLLDRFCKNDEILSEWNDIYKKYCLLFRESRDLDEEERMKNEKFMIYRMQKEELNFVTLMQDDEESLLKKHKLLSNSEKIHSRIRDILAIITGEDGGLISRVKTISRDIEVLGEFKSSLINYKKEIDASFETYLELEREVESLDEDLEFSESEMDDLEEQMLRIKKLKSKYNLDFKGLRSYCFELDEKIKRLENMEISREDLQRKIQKSKEAVIKKAKILSNRRRDGAKDLEKLIEKELKQLAIKNVKFEVRFISRMHDGIEKETAEFFIKTNIGDEMKPLCEITSSGEISRIMLALKKIFSDVDDIPILIFDEIDSNIGGETVVVVGEKLKKISEKHQLIVITHMPQIAKFARWHLSVRKEEKHEKTLVIVKKLEKEKRIKEIARMMGGENITSVVIRHAEELIKGGE